VKLYHVSYKHLGQEVTLYPRVPTNRATNEPANPPRVSTASRVSDCLRLFPWRDYHHKVNVYYTEVKRVARVSRTLPMRYLPDWKKWGREEVWLLNKEGYRFRWLGQARMFRMPMMSGSAFWYFKKGGESYPEWDGDPSRLVTQSAWQQLVEWEASNLRATRVAVREFRKVKVTA